jgi:3'5'-cyclic nucleotide phosphodiesterase
LPGKTCLDEIVDVIQLPKFDAKAAPRVKSHNEVHFQPEDLSQIRELMAMIASAYHTTNSFHNWFHACHVTMTVDKLLQRIAAPEMESTEGTKSKSKMASHLHDFTYGITSDPLTILAIVFSALIHDIDHRGVSNVQLAKEDEAMAELYRNKSIAEQNSVEEAWPILIHEKFAALRVANFGNQSELLRFRQVVVNIVLAPDIFDKEINDLRKARWNKAFSESALEESIENEVDTRAAIVMEHIIQASDVSHTMQH